MQAVPGVHNSSHTRSTRKLFSLEYIRPAIRARRRSDFARVRLRFAGYDPKLSATPESSKTRSKSLTVPKGWNPSPKVLEWGTWQKSMGPHVGCGGESLDHRRYRRGSVRIDHACFPLLAEQVVME